MSAQPQAASAGTAPTIRFAPVAEGLLLPEGPVAMADGSILLDRSGARDGHPREHLGRREFGSRARRRPERLGDRP